MGEGGWRGRMGGWEGESSSHLISDCPPRGILPKALSILYLGTNHRETFKMSFFKAKKGGAAASKEEMRHRREVKRFLYKNQKN